jgi:hypothetical protein
VVDALVAALLSPRGVTNVVAAGSIGSVIPVPTDTIVVPVFALTEVTQ